MAFLSNAVDLFIEELNKVYHPHVNRLRQLILVSSPKMVESVKWNVPFYECDGMLCYIHPKKKQVNVGFYRGNELKDEHGMLSTQGKQVRHYVVMLDEEIKEEEFLMLLQEAIVLAEQVKFKKYRS